MSHILSFFVAATLVCSAHGQVNQFVGTPANPTHFLDFDNPFVSSGSISSTSTVFTNNGFISVDLIGTWSGTDSISAGSNPSGQSLVSSSGLLSIAGLNEALQGPNAGAGFDIRFDAPATEFGVLFIDQINFSYRVELFLGANSIGAGNFSYSGSFPAPPHYWTGPGAFDRVLVTWPTATAGVGIDNLAVAGVLQPTSYCTSGTTTNGCSANINASGNPDVAHSAACQVTVTGVEGQKTGIIFYGLASLPQPWCSMGGGTSFLCVKPPTMRTGPQSSGGTTNMCDGQLSLDWNAFQAANPAALGAPWMVGNKAFVQGWFRDPPACKTTSLSNAVELTYRP